MNQKIKEDKIIIIDFGSQVTKLIARRIRELKVFSEIVTLKDLKKKIYLITLKELFFQGAHQLLQKKNFPKLMKIFLI